MPGKSHTSTFRFGALATRPKSPRVIRAGLQTSPPECSPQLGWPARGSAAFVNFALGHLELLVCMVERRLRPVMLGDVDHGPFDHWWGSLLAIQQDCVFQYRDLLLSFRRRPRSN